MPYKHGVTGSSPVVPTIYLARWCSRLARQPVTLEVDGSSPFRVAISQLSRASCSALFASVAQLVEQGTENPRVVGSIPTGGTIVRGNCFAQDAGVAHLVERHLAKVEVASSSLVTRSKDKERRRVPYFIWYRGQVVRQRSAKPLFPSSNLGGTSKNRHSSTEGCRF